VRIGVVSDTHGFFDARLEELLAGVELILHAGDVGKQEVLDELGRIAPVRAVGGNVDSPQLGLPFRTTLQLGGIGGRGGSRAVSAPLATFASSLQPGVALQVELLHELPARQTDLEKWADHARVEGLSPRRREAFLQSFDHNTHVVIFGHSHLPCAVTLASRLFFNPGSAGKQRFSLPRCCGVLDVSAKRVEATILYLQQYNVKLPEKVRLTVGG